MDKLLSGIHHFQNEIFKTKSSLFESLHEEQKPHSLLITCSDSRINPYLFMHAEPGDLFVIRNAGNLIPPFGSPPSGEIATLEFALTNLDIENLIVCGHSQCGAMKALLDKEASAPTPHFQDWLEYAKDTKEIIDNNYGSTINKEEKLLFTIMENVLVQIEHLKTYPFVQKAIKENNIKLHAWLYQFEKGKIYSYEENLNRFTPIIQNS